MLHCTWLPLFAALRDDFLVDGDRGADNLDLRVIERERGVKEGQVLEGLVIDFEEEFTNVLIEVDFGFDAADIVRKGDREDRRGIAEGFASGVEVFLVESDVDGLTLGQVLGHKRVFHPPHEEVEVVGSDQTSIRFGLDESSIKFVG